MITNLPIRIYADFECFNKKITDPDNPKRIYKQEPITVGFYFFHLGKIPYILIKEQIVYNGLFG